MDVLEIAQLQEQHAAWKLLRAKNAPLILSFLGRFFIEDNHGAVSATVLLSELDDHLYDLEESAPGVYDRAPQAYLDDWSDPARGWLRKFYPHDSEEVYYDATPSVEKAYRWVQDLGQRSFVGTESRLHTLVELLRQMVYGSEADPEARIAELERRRAEIDAEIEAVRDGHVSLFDESALRERYQLFSSTARELLSDFRQVEENFRDLNRSAREQITAWQGSKGELLEQLVASRGDISASDQGRSFQAFYDFLLSERRQTELADLLDQVQQLEGIDADRRISRIHHDWADAAERTQQTVRHLSEQLRRFVEDQVWAENRRVLDLVKRVELAAVRARSNPPTGEESLGITINEPGVPISLPFERPLYTPQTQTQVVSLIDPEPELELDVDVLLASRFIDQARLAGNIRALVPQQSSMQLADLIEMYPIEDGVAELIGYLALQEEDITVEMDATRTIAVSVTDHEGQLKRVNMPEARVIRR